MSYCYEQGIPHSVFLGWSPEDKAKTLAFMMEKASRCEMCGTAQWEWDADKYAYEPVERFCMGCYLKGIADESAGQMMGTSIVMEPTRTVGAAQRHVRMRREQHG